MGGSWPDEFLGVNLLYLSALSVFGGRGILVSGGFPVLIDLSDEFFACL